MISTTNDSDAGYVALVKRDTAHSRPTPDEFNEANRFGYTKMVIWVDTGATEKWQFFAGRWQAVEDWHS